jgi:hypothetical protein
MSGPAVDKLSLLPKPFLRLQDFFVLRTLLYHSMPENQPSHIDGTSIPDGASQLTGTPTGRSLKCGQ